MTEEWRGIAGFPQYEVSNLGRVRSLWTAHRYGVNHVIKIKKLTLDAGGYEVTGLWVKKGVHPKIAKVARLVLQAFVGPCPEGHEAAHVDGVKTNNRVGNLAWKTPLENSKDKFVHGTAMLGQNNPAAKLDTATAYAIKCAVGGYKEVAKLFGVDRSSAWRIMTGRSWKHL